MENFDDIKALLSKKKAINEYLERIKSLGYSYDISKKKGLHIVNSDNGRYHFEGISELIGNEKLDQFVCTLENLIASELYKVKEENEKELSKYKIIKIYDTNTNISTNSIPNTKSTY